MVMHIKRFGREREINPRMISKAKTCLKTGHSIPMFLADRLRILAYKIETDTLYVQLLFRAT